MNQKATSKPSAITKLREIVRQEVKAAIREELGPLLVEIIKVSNKPVVQEASNSTPSQRPPYNPPPPAPSAPSFATSLLEETRQQMMKEAHLPGMEEYRQLLTPVSPVLHSTQAIDSSPYSELPVIDESVQHHTSVAQMVLTAGKSSKEENVEIAQVPDFTAFLSKINL